MESFKGKTVLVSGGGTGIGRAIAGAFVEAGARVAVSGRRREALDVLEAEHPDAVLGVPGDVTKSEDRTRIVTVTISGLDRLDVLVNWRIKDMPTHRSNRLAHPNRMPRTAHAAIGGPS